MSYVLTVIPPPVAPAAFGRAVTLGKAVTPELAASMLVNFVSVETGIPKSERPEITDKLLTARTQGSWSLHLTGPGCEGWRLRIDPADNAPHPCPCGEGEDNPCGRLVLPGETAYAHDPDAYCQGCYTWDRNIPGCLPANTAHTEEP